MTSITAEDLSKGITQDVLELVYPSTLIRGLFEKLVQEYVKARIPKGDLQEVDFDLIDRIHRSDERGRLTRLMREANNRRHHLLEEAVDAMLEHASALQGLDERATERVDYREFVFRCNKKGHEYRRRVLHEGENWEEKRKRVNPAQIKVRRENILYTTGDELIDEDNKLLCGICEEKTEGVRLSRVHLLRERGYLKQAKERVTAVLDQTYDRMKKKLRIPKSSFEDRVIESIAARYPDVRRLRRINWERMYEILENVRRKNIDEEVVFRHVSDLSRFHVVAAIQEHIPAPICAARSREKYNIRFSKKSLRYVVRVRIYDQTGRDGRVDPILKPIDLFGIRGVFATIALCRAINACLEDDDSFMTLPKKFKKDDLLGGPSSGYRSLHNAFIYQGAHGTLPFEAQFRTHEMDADSEYADKRQDHKNMEQKGRQIIRNAADPYMEPLFNALLAPAEHKYMMKLIAQSCTPTNPLPESALF